MFVIGRAILLLKDVGVNREPFMASGWLDRFSTGLSDLYRPGAVKGSFILCKGEEYGTVSRVFKISTLAKSKKSGVGETRKMSDMR